MMEAEVPAGQRYGLDLSDGRCSLRRVRYPKIFVPREAFCDLPRRACENSCGDGRATLIFDAAQVPDGRWALTDSERRVEFTVAGGSVLSAEVR